MISEPTTIISGMLPSSEKHRARALRNLTHELSYENAHEDALGSVHEDVHGNVHKCPRKRPQKLRFSVQNAPEGPHEDSRDSAHGKFDSAHANVHENVARSIFTCPIFTGFVCCPHLTLAMPNRLRFQLGLLVERTQGSPNDLARGGARPPLRGPPRKRL